MERSQQEIVDCLIAYWSHDTVLVDPDSRRDCRQIVAELARSLSATDLIDFQEDPLRHRARIEASVASWLAARTPRTIAAEERPSPGLRNPPVVPAEKRIVQYSRGETVNSIGEIGSIENLTFGASAPAARSRKAGAQAEGGAADEKVRILFLGANPSDSTRLRLDQEVREIDQALGSAALGSRFELCQKWAVRTTDLQGYLLRIKPRILHFSGHGTESAIILENERGIGRPVEGARLARLLGNFSQDLRCVMLNACYSAEQAEAIAEQVDCVVGMSVAVIDRVAVRFAASFYLAVASGCSVRESFDQASADIDIGERGQDGVPRLMTRRCDPAKLVLVSAD